MSGVGAGQISSSARFCRINAAFRLLSERRIYAAGKISVVRPSGVLRLEQTCPNTVYYSKAMKHLRLVLLLIAPIMASAQWGPDIKLSTNEGSAALNENMGRCLIANGDAVHVVWCDLTNNGQAIYYKRSLDGGLTWGAESTAANLERPRSLRRPRYHGLRFLCSPGVERYPKNLDSEPLSQPLSRALSRTCRKRPIRRWIRPRVRPSSHFTWLFGQAPNSAPFCRINAAFRLASERRIYAAAKNSVVRLPAGYCVPFG
jgi:hypothetical protein